jgi:bifunctional DNase/RNase
MSLARLLQNLESPRPMAPQFMFNALRAVGARVIEVRIDRLAANTSYAVAVIEGPAGTTEVDARPSDALNAALLADARITVRRAVLDAAATGADQTMANLAEKFPLATHEIADSGEFAAQARLVRRAPADTPKRSAENDGLTRSGPHKWERRQIVSGHPARLAGGCRRSLGAWVLVGGL